MGYICSPVIFFFLARHEYCFYSGEDFSTFNLYFTLNRENSAMADGMVTGNLSSPKNKVLIMIKGGKCRKVVRNGIVCDHCDMWFHFEKCSDVTAENIPENEWCCSACVGVGHDVSVKFNELHNTMSETLQSDMKMRTK